MKQSEHPSIEAMSLASVMQAMADPCRQKIVQTLLQRSNERLACNEFGLDISKATASHHFETLRKAGLIKKEYSGTKCLTSLRVEDIEARFPGLLKLIEAEFPVEA